VAACTVSRVLVRREVSRLAGCDPPTGHAIRSSKATANRYVRGRPRQLLHIDVKKLGRIPDCGGWRVLGRKATVASRHKKVRIGFYYVHTVSDDHARRAYTEIHRDEKRA
jgi:hypothetical protein